MSRDFDNIEDIFKESFSDFKVEPQSQVWNKVEQNLKWKRFWHFHYRRFNIYYLFLLVVAGIGGMLLWNMNNQHKYFTQNNETDEKTYQSEIISNENKVVSKNNVRQPNKKQKTKKTDNKNRKHIRKTTELTDKIKPDSLKITGTNKPKNTIQVKKQPMNKNYQYPKKTNTAPADDNTLNIKTEKKDSTLIDSIKKEPKQKSKNLQSDTICLQIPAIHPKLNQLQLDTIAYTAYALKYDSMKTPMLNNQETKHWMAELFYSPLVNQANRTTANHMLKNNVLLRSDANSQQVSYTLGAKIGYHLKKWDVQTGLAYTQINENFSYQYQEYDIYSKYYYEHAFSEIQVTDTVGWLQFGKESAYDNMAPVMHSRTETIHDSTLTMVYDTTSRVTTYENPNTFSYLEIPVLFGYSFNNRKFDYTLHGGIIAGILLNRKGKTISLSDNSAVSVESEPMQNTSLIMYGSLAMHYKFSQQFGIVAEPYIKTQVNSLFESSYPISQKYNSFGVKIGLRFMF